MAVVSIIVLPILPTNQKYPKLPKNYYFYEHTLDIYFVIKGLGSGH
jgi:hypothetical protein